MCRLIEVRLSFQKCIYIAVQWVAQRCRRHAEFKLKSKGKFARYWMDGAECVKIQFSFRMDSVPSFSTKGHSVMYDRSKRLVKNIDLFSVWNVYHVFFTIQNMILKWRSEVETKYTWLCIERVLFGIVLLLWNEYVCVLTTLN